MNKLLLYPFCVDVPSREEEIVWKQCNDEEKKTREKRKSYHNIIEITIDIYCCLDLLILELHFDSVPL